MKVPLQFRNKTVTVPAMALTHPTDGPPSIRRIAVPMTDDELAILDRLRASDRRTRPEQVKWLVEQEAARRRAA